MELPLKYMHSFLDEMSAALVLMSDNEVLFFSNDELQDTYT